jgi:hypothetical protein
MGCWNMLSSAYNEQEIKTELKEKAMDLCAFSQTKRK